MEYGTGAVKDLRDERNYEYDHLIFGEPIVDWEVGFDIEKKLKTTLPVKDQKSSTSCVGQAWASYLYVKNWLELAKIYQEKTIEHLSELSAKAIYSQITLGYKAGARIADGGKLAKNWGAISELIVPSQENGLTSEDFMINKSWWTALITEQAKVLQVKEYRIIRAEDNIDMVAQTIQENDGAVIGFTGSNNSTWRNTFPKPPKPEEKTWGHALYGGKFKLINGKKHIGILNSWGKDTGEQGWQWIDEIYFKSGNVFNPWTLIDKPNAIKIKLLDRNGKPRELPAFMFKAIRYLIEKRRFTLK